MSTSALSAGVPGGGRPMVASMQPVAVPKEADKATDADDSATAGALLKQAFDYFKADQNAQAALAFRAAINTGNLNDAGRALAYWHVYVAEQTLHHPDEAADALAGFVVVAQDVLAIRTHLRYAEDENGDFVDRFDLRHRLARARAMLSASWATRADKFGRSENLPVLVHDQAEQDYFLEAALPCSEGQSRKVLHVAGAHVDRVNVSCDGGRGSSYFFQTMSTPGEE